MELTRVDYIILSFLRKRNCISHFKSATLKEIMQLDFREINAEIMHIAGNSRPTTYRRMMNLCKYGYVEKGCKDINADTFYLLDKGIKIVESGGKNND